MKMTTQKVSRRVLMAGAVSVVASAALPAGAKAKSETQADPDPWFDARLYAMSDAMKNVKIMEVLSNSFAPHYRKGDLVFVKPETAQPSDHVFLKRKGVESVFGVLVHRDAKAIYVRGFRAGDRLQSVPLRSISEWGRIVMNCRV